MPPIPKHSIYLTTVEKVLKGCHRSGVKIRKTVTAASISTDANTEMRHRYRNHIFRFNSKDQKNQGEKHEKSIVFIVNRLFHHSDVGM